MSQFAIATDLLEVVPATAKNYLALYFSDNTQPGPSYDLLRASDDVLGVSIASGTIPVPAAAISFRGSCWNREEDEVVWCSNQLFGACYMQKVGVGGSASQIMLSSAYRDSMGPRWHDTSSRIWGIAHDETTALRGLSFPADLASSSAVGGSFTSPFGNDDVAFTCQMSSTGLQFYSRPSAGGSVQLYELGTGGIHTVAGDFNVNLAISSAQTRLGLSNGDRFTIGGSSGSALFNRYAIGGSGTELVFQPSGGSAYNIFPSHWSAALGSFSSRFFDVQANPDRSEFALMTRNAGGTAQQLIRLPADDYSGVGAGTPVPVVELPAHPTWGTDPYGWIPID